MGISNWAKRLLSGSPGGAADTAAAGPAAVENHVRRGVAALGEGRFEAAVEAFREAVRLEPSSAANHVNLAYALQQTDADAGALRHLRHAIERDPESFDARYMLAGMLEKEGDPDGAIAQLGKAVELRPEVEGARVDLCRLLATTGQTSAALAAIETAIALSPDNPDFHHYLGNLHLGDASPGKAIESYRRALRLRPDYAQVHSNLGLALHRESKFDEAVQAFESALAIDPGLAEAHANLGSSFRALREYDKAEANLRRAIALQPGHAENLNQLGTVAMERGDLDAAIAHFRHAIQLSPGDAGPYGNLGIALFEKGLPDDAIAAYRHGLSIKSVKEIHENLGNALIRRGSLTEAVEQFGMALTLAPDDANTKTNLAVAHSESGDLPAAIALLRDVLAQTPDQLVAHNNLLFYLSYFEGCSAADYLAEARRYDAKLLRGSLEPPAAPSLARSGPLRIGFVSGDLCMHPVGFFLEGVLQHLDRNRFELFAYATVRKFDQLSERLRPRFTRWRVLKGMTHHDAARMIRDDRIDILIDLSGHSADNRLGVFALRPAPVQVTWLGYFASTGVAEIDYLLADDGCLPGGEERFMSERVWRLPDTRMCYTPLPASAAPDVEPLPALVHGHLTFGCFQRFTKITDGTLAAWGKVFEALPDANLFLQCQQCVSPELVARMLGRLASVGIAGDRVTTRPSTDYRSYLAAHALVDINLDTWPYTGGTTTCEALWMGVPTLTLEGNSMLARQGAAMMKTVGLRDWVATDADDFAKKAVGFAADLEALSALRSRLREQAGASPLFDTRLFAGRFGDALTSIWQESAHRVTNPGDGADQK